METVSVWISEMSGFGIKVHPALSYDSKTNTTRREPHPLRPILLSLSVLGIRLEDTSGGLKKALFRLQSVLVLLGFHYWALTDIVWYFRNRIREDMIAESVTVWASVCTVDFLLLKRRKFLKVLEAVEEESLKMSPKSQSWYRNVVKIVCASIWIYILVFIGQYFIFSPQMQYEKYFSNTPMVFFYESMSETQVTVFFLVDRTIESFFIQGTLTMIIALYALTCFNVRLWFRTFKPSPMSIRRQRTPLGLDGVRKFTSSFERLSKNVRRLDDVFSRTMAMWLLMIFINLCVRILFLLNPTCCISNEMVATISMALIRAFVTLLTVCLIAHEVSQESLSGLATLDDLMRRNEDSWTPSVYHEVQLAYTRLSFFPVQLTVWKFASLNRAFMMTSIGMMTTYVIICIQLNPKAMASLAG